MRGNKTQGRVRGGSPRFCMKLKRSSRNSFLLGSPSSSYSCTTRGENRSRLCRQPPHLSLHPGNPPSSPSKPMRGRGQLPQVPGECQEALWSSTASQGSERGAVGSQYPRGSGRACPQPPASHRATGVAGTSPLGAGGAPLQLGLHLPRPGLVTVPRGLPWAHGHVEPLAGGSQVAGGRVAPRRVPEFPGNLTRWELSAG